MGRSRADGEATERNILMFPVIRPDTNVGFGPALTSDHDFALVWNFQGIRRSWRVIGPVAQLDRATVS